MTDPALPQRETVKHEDASPAFRRRGWIGAVLLAPPLVATLLLPPMVAAGSWGDLAMSLFAWPTLIAGAALRFWSTLHIGGRKRVEVVEDGPYAMCRNPLYLGTLLNVSSAALFLESPLLLAGALLLALSYVALTIPAEERFLAAKLGEPYRDYCRRVPRLLPRLSLLHAPRKLEVDVAALGRECRRAFWWILIPVLSEVLSFVHARS